MLFIKLSEFNLITSFSYPNQLQFHIPIVLLVLTTYGGGVTSHQCSKGGAEPERLRTPELED